MSDCIFCKIANGEIPAELVYESEKVIAFKDINPQAPVHILIIPREHIANHLQMNDPSIFAEVGQAINQLAKDLQIAETGFRTINNCGQDGGQEVEHIHWHLLGGRQLNWPPG